MSPRPAIFISAVSSELKSARQLVADTLTFLGYDPKWQDIFGTEEGDLRAILRHRIDSCQGLVQLVGTCYGAESPVVDEQFGRVSYTQYEAFYAKSKGKKVWYLFWTRVFPLTHTKKRTRKDRSSSATTAPRLRQTAIFTTPLVAAKALKRACSSCAMISLASGVGLSVGPPSWQCFWF